MSRRKPTQLTSLEQRFLNSPTCILWPDCACHKNLVHWQDVLWDDDRFFTLTPEQLEWAEEVLFCTCACVAEHCPDPKIKAYGARQFLNLSLRRERIAAAQQRAEAN
jgi:hypothetical protein